MCCVKSERKEKNMTTQKKNPVAKATKKSTSSITINELNNVLTETLNKVAAAPEAKPEPVKELSNRGKTALMVVMLSRPEGATLKEMADQLGWKENSIRGAMSLYAKNEKKTIASEKKDGVRTYYLKANA